MKRFTLVILVLMLTSVSVFSQPQKSIKVGDTLYTLVKSDTSTTTMIDSTNDMYVVKAGDNLWELSGTFLRDPLKWREVFQKNPFLMKPGRMFWRNGKIIVLIYPGEVLQGLNQFKVEKVKVINNFYYARDWYIPWWIFLLMGLLLLGWFVTWYSRRDGRTGSAHPRQSHANTAHVAPTLNSAPAPVNPPTPAPAPAPAPVPPAPAAEAPAENASVAEEASPAPGEAVKQEEIVAPATDPNPAPAPAPEEKEASPTIFKIGGEEYSIPPGKKIEIRTITIQG